MTRLTKRNLLAIASSVFLACVSAGSSVSGGEAQTVTSVTWSVQEGASGGTVSSAGLYTASATAGTYHVVATSQADPTRSAFAIVTVSASTPAVPIISTFSASPASLPAGGGNTTLSWSVTGATSMSIDQGVGAVTGTSKTVSVTSTAVYTLTATNASGSATAQTSVYVGSSGAGFNLPSGCRFSAIVAPIDGETFIQGTTDLRFVGVGSDCNRPTNTPTTGLGGSADTVQFLVDGAVAYSQNWDSAEFNYFKGYATVTLAPGNHTVVARAIYTTYSPAQTIDSAPVTITVVAAPAYAQTIDLTGDTNAATMASLVGSSTSRIRVNGNGHTISGGTAVNWQYMDFYDVGSRTSTSTPGIVLTPSSGAVTVQNCRFYYSNAFQLSPSGSTSASVAGNVWASNSRNPVGQYPAAYGSTTMPAVILGGGSGAKTFAGNNIGAGHVDASSASNWTIGGTRDADSNVFIGPRVGIYIAAGGASNVLIQRNFSQHLYFGGWSQGGNFELGASNATSTTVTTKHNVVAGGSWPVRMPGGEFAYNLILMGTEEGSLWLGPSNGVNVHHNVIVGGCNAQARSCIGQFYGGTAAVHNNTVDARNLAQGGWNPGPAISSDAAGSMTATSNAIVRIKPGSKPVSASATLSADYNLFFDAGPAPFYTDARTPPHDVAADPLFTSPSSYEYHYVLRDVWQRTKTAYSILQDYRTRYTPQAGSPALDAGNASVYGSGNCIGAIGATGSAAAYDLFGK